MSGNASRYSHQPNRRYSLLLPSQGAMVTDADQREAAEIQLTNTATLGDTATLPAFGDFRLTDVRFENEEVALDICDPCATVLSDPQFDTGNHLFRLEVHDAPLNRPETSGAFRPRVASWRFIGPDCASRPP